MTIEFTFDGFDKVLEDLKKEDYARQRNLLLSAVRAGGEVALEKMESLAPSESGRLRTEMIQTTAGTQSDISSVAVFVGPSTLAFYGGFQELGTAHHPPQAFIDPALESEEERILEAMIDKLERRLARGR